jgi:hypothetical protein
MLETEIVDIHEIFYGTSATLFTMSPFFKEMCEG